MKITKCKSCEGCNNDETKQTNHMECPGGCLHDKTQCDMCILIKQVELETKNENH